MANIKITDRGEKELFWIRKDGSASLAKITEHYSPDGTDSIPMQYNVDVHFNTTISMDLMSFSTDAIYIDRAQIVYCNGRYVILSTCFNTDHSGSVALFDLIEEEEGPRITIKQWNIRNSGACYFSSSQDLCIGTEGGIAHCKYYNYDRSVSWDRKIIGTGSRAVSSDCTSLTQGNDVSISILSIRFHILTYHK